MPFKDKEKKRQYHKQWRDKNKKKRNLRQREHYHQNREAEIARARIYQQTPKYIKSRRIKDWNYQGIIFHDMDLLHDIYEQTTHCDNCGVFLQGLGNARKCLDHDHSITDDENVRNILCNRCNIIRR